jgi:hypothetical protein
MDLKEKKREMGDGGGSPSSQKSHRPMASELVESGEWLPGEASSCGSIFRRQIGDPNPGLGDEWRDGVVQFHQASSASEELRRRRTGGRRPEGQDGEVVGRAGLGGRGGSLSFLLRLRGGGRRSFLQELKK